MRDGFMLLLFQVNFDKNKEEEGKMKSSVSSAQEQTVIHEFGQPNFRNVSSLHIIINFWARYFAIK